MNEKKMNERGKKYAQMQLTETKNKYLLRQNKQKVREKAC